MSSESGAKLPPYAPGTARKPIPITGLRMTGTLPKGLRFQASTGAIYGTIENIFQKTIITVYASNFVGESSKQITLHPISVGANC